MAEQAREFPRLSGYEITEIVCEGKRSRIYRGRCEADAAEVMLKSPSPEYVDGGDPAYLSHEYEIMQRLSGEHVVLARALENHHEPPFLVLEDFGGESLDRIARRRPLELAELLRVGIRVAEGLSDIHAAGVVHRDINPSNIVYSPRDGTVKIIDFGIASRISSGHGGAAPADAPAGSLPYISPEQTGRMNRAVDYRTDFYSLGATLYELLTHRPLFFVDDPVEWLHYHVAKRPQPPAEFDSRIPRVLSDIVMRLLSKNAEDRYQSATGIAADLRTCLDRLTEDNAIESFPLGRKDAHQHFLIPQRLYGRDVELGRLRAAFERACAGNTEFALVSGPMGAGKTALVQELRQMVSERHGYFAAGHFDHLSRHVPYRGLAIALGELFRQLLTESPGRLEVWRKRLRKALGSNAGLISEVIPELELILGELPPPLKLPPREAERLFHRLIVSLLRVFCRPEHPLVIFLDDEQWIDAATLKLAGAVMGKGRPEHVLFIGAYRDSEVGPQHPLMHTVRQLRDSEVSLTEIELAPLDRTGLGELVADTLKREPDEVRPLADLVHAKTAGNPLFVGEFLARLHREGLITFDPDISGWQWDTAAIAAEQMTDNVVDLLAERLRALPGETRDLLRLAACLGRDFDLHELALAAEESTANVIRGIREALDSDLLMPVGKSDRMLALGQLPAGKADAARFIFAHDRIHEAISGFDDEAEQHCMHLRIGRLLWQRLSAEQRRERLFELVKHLNIGRTLITEADERLQLCRLNLEAAHKAKVSTAYAVALGYLRVALELLPRNAWSEDYELAFSVHAETAENAYLCGEHEVLERVSAAALATVVDQVDRSRIREIQIAALLARSRWSEATALAWRTMRELGIRMPAHPNRFHLLLARALLKWRLRGKSVEDLAHLPVMQEGRIAAAMRIGTQLGTVAFVRQPLLFSMLMYGGVAACAKLGNSERTVHVYSGYGMLLGTVHGDIPRAQALGRLAIEIAEGLQDNQAWARTLFMYNGFIRHRREPLQASLEPLLEAYRLSVDTGDFEYAGHALNIHSYYAYYAGTHLGTLVEKIAEHRENIAELGQSGMLHYATALRQMALNLTGESEEPTHLKADLEGMGWVREGEAGRDYQFLLSVYSLKTELAYRFRQYDDALASAEEVRRYLGNDLGLHNVTVFHFYDALTCLAAARERCGWGRRRRLLRRARRGRRRLRYWADHNPYDFEHKCLLLDAETARLRGDHLRAHGLYDQAIELATDRGFVHEAALACELVADMHHEAGRDPLAGLYLFRARHAYRRWGALAKVQDLERRYASLLQKPAVRRAGTTTSSTYGDTTTGSLGNIDIASLIKALRAIVDQRVHSRMLEAVINTAIEFAGAQHGALLLADKNGTLCVEAEASVDDGGATRILQSVPLSADTNVSQAVVNYVAQTYKGVVVHDASEPHPDLPGLDREEYIRQENIRSILALPIFTGATDGNLGLIGVLYLENNHASHTFTEARFSILEIICLAAAGRLELSRRAAIDGLTQLYNREYFEYMLRQELAITGRQNRNLALILADIDHFKQFNDTWGHQAGDAVLEAVAGTVKDTVRYADLAARYGGEEIAVILPETDLEDAIEVAERIRQAVAALEIPHQGRPLGVTLSLGVACLEAASADAATLIQQADEALYIAKAEGRDRVVTVTSRS